RPGWGRARGGATSPGRSREPGGGGGSRRGWGPARAPKPIPGQAGNGCHLHLSLRDLGGDGQPGEQRVFYDPADRYQLSQTGYYFIGGLLAPPPPPPAPTARSGNRYPRRGPHEGGSAHTVFSADKRPGRGPVYPPPRVRPAA